MVIDVLDRRVAKTLALLDSPEGQFFYSRNKYQFHLKRRNNICGIIEKACGRLKWENLIAVYNAVEERLASRKKEWAAG
jgi:hypothetical protein